MTKVVLDTNFIMTCVKQKIDFFEELQFMGFKILVPKQVVSELKKNKAEVALTLLERERNSFEVIDLGVNYVDKGIIKFASQNPEITIATLDKEIKKAVKNQKVIIRGKKKLEVV